MENRSNNIAAHLPRMAELQPQTAALHIPQTKSNGYRSYTYLELENESNRVAYALELSGIHRGMRVALMVPPGLDFFALTFALFKIGAVPVLIDPGIGVRNLKTCLAEAEPQAFVGIPKAHAARLLFGWGKATLKILITVGRPLFRCGKSLARLSSSVPAEKKYRPAQTSADETAAILFTSGSTGPPKGVIYTHGNFNAQVEQLKRVYAIEPGEIDLPTFPLFALFAPALGMSSVIPVMDFTRPGSVDPRNIVQPLQQFNATTMFGSPALIRRVGEYGAKNGITLPALKRVISAGAPVPAVVLERFDRLLREGIEVFTPYGSTEALPVCSIGSREILRDTRQATDRGEGVCIGCPVPDIDLKIIRISDEPIAEWSDDLVVADGEIGEIAVSGPQVTQAYYNRPQSTRLAKIRHRAGQACYHRMGDLGYRDSRGRIWFCGRKSQRVECPDKTYYTIPCEAVFNSHPQVFRSALVGIKRDGRIQPVICLETPSRVGGKEQARILREVQSLARQHPLTADLRDFLFHPGFPVDIRHNAKIFREKLAIWAQGKIK